MTTTNIKKIKNKKEDAVEIIDLGDWAQTLAPVSLTYLSQAFRKQVQTVKRRLAKITPVEVINGHPKYDFYEAAAYLVEPKIDISDWLKSKRVQDLPLHLRKELWQAKEAEQRFKIRAGELWHTEDVVEVLSDAFKAMRTTISLWSADIEKLVIIDPEIRRILRVQSDKLQAELYESLCELPQTKMTKSSLSDPEFPDDKGDDEYDI